MTLPYSHCPSCPQGGYKKLAIAEVDACSPAKRCVHDGLAVRVKRNATSMYEVAAAPAASQDASDDDLFEGQLEAEHQTEGMEVEAHSVQVDAEAGEGEQVGAELQEDAGSSLGSMRRNVAPSPTQAPFLDSSDEEAARTPTKKPAATMKPAATKKPAAEKIKPAAGKKPAEALQNYEAHNGLHYVNHNELHRVNFIM